RLRALLERLSRQRDHGHRRRKLARRSAFARRTLRRALRDRRAPLHFLRYVRRGVSHRRDRPDAALRNVGLPPRIVHLRERSPARAARSRPRNGSRRSPQRHSVRSRTRRGDQIDRRHGRRLRCNVARHDSQDANQRAGWMTLAFWVLAVLLVASAIFIITAEKPVYSVAGLLAHFFFLAIT